MPTRTTQQIVTRFAPSPTGLLHAGNYRTAIFAYLTARHANGTFIVRIEDTDRARSKKEYEENILETLDWLGLEYDYLHRQSEWVGEHEHILRTLVARDKAYVSVETSDDGSTKELIRFRNPNKSVTFTDLIRGDITMDTTDLGDFVIAKSFTEPLFHLVVVTDDALMGVNRVIRGEDHISNTPRQLLIYEALGAIPPVYAHLPLVLAPDRSKLSKRRGAKALLEYRELGFLPEAFLNYLGTLGWHPGSDEEFFTKEELIQRFDLEQVQKSGAIFDEVKLTWFNREHLLRMGEERFAEKSVQYLSPTIRQALEASGRLRAVLQLLRERIETFGDIRAFEEAGEFSYFAKAPTFEAQNLVWKQDAGLEKPKKHLAYILGALEALDAGSFTKETVRDAVWTYAETEGKGSVLWPFRYALTGVDRSPDPFEVAGILGKDETCSRLRAAQKLL